MPDEVTRRWYQVRSLCRQAVNAGQYEDTVAMRRLLARIANQLDRIDEVVEVAAVDVTETWDADLPEPPAVAA